MRRLLSIASAVSLLLLVATVALAVLSFDRSLSFLVLTPGTIHAIYLDEYAVGYFRNNNEYVDTNTGRHQASQPLPLGYSQGLNRGVPMANFSPAQRHGFLGIFWAESKTTSVDSWQTSRIITIRKRQLSLLWPLIVFGILPCNRLVRHQRELHAQRSRAGRCITCAYDLKGNVSGICPECGTPIVKNPIARG